MGVYRVIIIGSGFGGQCAAVNLRRIGIEDFLILERREFMGGTWCQNSYPGAAVDVQSPLYSLSFEPYDWSRMFAEQSELEDYTGHVIDKHRLRDRTRIGTDVTRLEWNEAEQLWDVHARDRSGDAIRLQASSIVNATGPLSTPVIPDFPGRDVFKGRSFHTNEWDHGYDLNGKRVAVIGSGASAAQIIPAIAPRCGALHVFQRTPHWVLPRPDRTFTPWQRRLLRNRAVYRGLRAAIYLGLETRVIGFKYSRTMLKLVAQRKALKHIRAQIRDPALRRAVTPDFTIGCKRVILSNTLYPAYCRDNVTLHPRDQGIAAITETGITTISGQRIDLDLIVYSTGYDATDGVISYPVIGRRGRRLADVWQPYPRAYLGTAIPGFPNFFVVTGPNTGIGHTSAIFVIEAQMSYIMRALETLRDRRVGTIEPSVRAEADYTAMIHSEMERTVWKSGGCQSWYKSADGHVVAMFPGFSFTFRRLARNFKQRDHVLG
jgi:cation diffusion facilitator CzcD-associated flavoprotein CzcO